MSVDVVAEHDVVRPLRVLTHPGPHHRRNPYVHLLYHNLRRFGVESTRYRHRYGLVDPSADLFHVHWPEHLPAPPNTGRPGKYLIVRANLAAIKRRGTKIVWTAHNLRPHRRSDVWVPPSLYDWFTQRVDGVITHSHTALEAIVDRYPHLRKVPSCVVPHGHYRGAYLDDVDQARARAFLDLKVQGRVILFFGKILPYKNVEALIRTFLAINDSSLRLVVAGEPDTRSTVRRLRAISAGSDRIRLDLARISEGEIQHYFRGADLVCLPFSEIMHSGSAILALSFDRPVLVPDIGAMGELQHDIGNQWVRTYPGDLTSSVLRGVLDWLDEPRPPSPDLAALSWSRVARATATFYRSLVEPNGVSAP